MGLDCPRLLSFGCSTGEEVFSLRRYFPAAEIVGIDINPWAIAVCRRRLAAVGGDPRIRFVQAANLDGLGAAAFDVIFCMAVFRHADLGAAGISRCDPVLRWADFQSAVAELDRCLAPGGLLAIMLSNFRFKDTATAARFETVFTIDLPSGARDTPLFGPDNRRICDGPYNEAIFRKPMP